VGQARRRVRPLASVSALALIESPSAVQTVLPAATSCRDRDSSRDIERNKGKWTVTEKLVMNTPPVVSAEEWEAAYQELLVEEKN
jgi:hypothetical protein